MTESNPQLFYHVSSSDSFTAGTTTGQVLGNSAAGIRARCWSMGDIEPPHGISTLKLSGVNDLLKHELKPMPDGILVTVSTSEGLLCQSPLDSAEVVS